MNVMNLLALALTAGGSAILAVRAIGSIFQPLSTLRSRAELQFKATRVEELLQSICFDGSLATRLESSETQHVAALIPANYVLTVKAAMPDGTRYVFRSAANGRPWVQLENRGKGHAVQGSAPF
jgi:hypothetical protein